MSRQVTKMRAKSEIRRKIILQAATKLFLKLGYERMSMTELNQQLGYSKATLYNYFASKQELFIESILNIAKQQIKELIIITNFFNDKNVDLWLTLESFGFRLIKLHLTPSLLNMRRILIAEGDHFEFAEMIYSRGPKKCTESLTVLFEHALQQGLIHHTDAKTLAIQFQGLLEYDLVQKRLCGLSLPITDAHISHHVQAAVKTLRQAYETKR